MLSPWKEIDPRFGCDGPNWGYGTIARYDWDRLVRDLGGVLLKMRVETEQYGRREALVAFPFGDLLFADNGGEVNVLRLLPRGDNRAESRRYEPAIDWSVPFDGPAVVGPRTLAYRLRSALAGLSLGEIDWDLRLDPSDWRERR